MKWIEGFMMVAIVFIFISLGSLWEKVEHLEEAEALRALPEVQPFGHEDEVTISLEDRFANLMESLSDNGTMKYKVVIRANLYEDSMPDTVEITLYLAEGENINK